MKKNPALKLVLSAILIWAGCSQLPKGVVSKATQINKKGVMLECTFYQNGKPVAKNSFAANGQYLKTEGKIPDGPVKHLFSNNAVSMEFNYINNKKDGPYKAFNPEGRLLSEGGFKADQLDGVIKTHDEKNVVTVERSYKEGVLHGPSRWLYENGNVKVEKNYKNGLEHGVFVWKDPTGKVTATETYKNGNKIK